LLNCPNCKKDDWKTATKRKNGKLLKPNAEPYDNSKDNFLVCKNCNCLITTRDNGKTISNHYATYWVYTK